jgi:hypothetical protein
MIAMSGRGHALTSNTVRAVRHDFDIIVWRKSRELLCMSLRSPAALPSATSINFITFISLCATSEDFQGRVLQDRTRGSRVNAPIDKI